MRRVCGRDRCSIVLRFFHEAGNSAGVIELHDAEGAGLGTSHGDSGDCDVGLCGFVRFEHGAKVHAVKLVSGEDQHVANAVFLQEPNLLSHGICGPLVPVGSIERLLGSEDFDKTIVEQVEIICLANVAMETDGVELCEYVNATDVAVDAVGNWHIDEPVFATKRNGRLGAMFGEWQESSTFAAAKDQADCIPHWDLFHEIERGWRVYGDGRDWSQGTPGVCNEREPSGSQCCINSAQLRLVNQHSLRKKAHAGISQTRQGRFVAPAHG